jgi:hypothetical protein
MRTESNLLRNCVSVAAVVAADLVLAALGQAAEFHYVLVFAAQGHLNLPRHSHTWATFVKASGEGPDANSYRLEAHTISWMPRALAIEPLRLQPEVGTNLDLAATFRWAQSLNLELFVWGPYQIDAELYARAMGRIAYLQGGHASYKAIDAGFAGPEVMDCIHAVSDLTTGVPIVRFGTPGWGSVASGVVAHSYRPWIVNPWQTHPWVAQGIGVNLSAFQQGRNSGKP